MMTQTQHVLRDGDRQVSFYGELLSSSSSEEDGKDRWSEMYIYLKSDGSGYVVHGAGMSSREGETSREWVRDCHTADAVIKTLTRTADDISYMPKLNVVLLQRAAMIDDALHDAASTQAI